MKSHSKTILVLVIIGNIVLLVGYYLLFQHIKSQTQAASALISTIDSSQQKNSHLNSLRAVVKDTEVEREQLASFLLPSDGEVAFIEQVEALGKSSGLEIKTNSVSSVPNDVSETKTFKMQIQASGSWSNILYFLSQVENMSYDIRVQDVSLSKPTTTGKVGSSSWSMMFDINVTESA